MSDWRTPEFEEIRMDAEINCYCSVLPDPGRVSSLRSPAIDVRSAPRPDGRASS